MPDSHYISTQVIDLKTVDQIIFQKKKLALSDEAILNINKSYQYLQDKLKINDAPIFYGINTGFGSLCDVKISNDKLELLQENLVMSHACGTGDLVPQEIVRLMLLFKIQSLSYGNSGVQLATVERLVDFYNHDILPVVYTQGSLGASGDLAPLAHLSLPLIGHGEVFYQSKRITTAELYKILQWEPIKLQAKEGLALLNGTQFMSAYGIYILLKSIKLSYQADLIAALSLDAFTGSLDPFNPLIHLARPHRGQVKTAERITEFLEGSTLIKQKKENVQDPYSFRCVPQVHGATKDTIEFVRRTFKTEINSVTDNPNIFLSNDLILSGGNFHGQPLALGLDYLSIAMAELGNISERRTYQLISGSRGLPAFLVKNPGLNSGFMIPQYVAAALVSQNKQLATPASVDSIVSSNGQEDHVSMGANAAVKCLQIINNVEKVLAIELFNASQALSFRGVNQTSPLLVKLVKDFQKIVSPVENDRILSDDIEKARAFLEAMRVDLDKILD